MTKKQTGQYAMLVRVSNFWDARKDKFPEGSESQKAFGVIASVLAQINAFNGDKQAKRKDTRDTKLATKRVMVERLVAINKSAKVLAKAMPDADARFPLLPRQSDVAALQSGLLFLREAAPVKDRFIQCGLDPTFLEDLQQAVTAFQRAIAERSDARVGAVVSRKAIGTAIKKGVDAVKSLDTLVANTLGRDEAAMNEWKGKRYIPKQGAHSSGDGTVPAPAAEPAPAPPAAEPTTNAAEEPLRRAS